MQEENVKPNFEFIALMASLMSIVALALDALLPALSQVGESINSFDSTDNQMLITMIFLGLGVGQLFFGPLSDSYGRKPIVYAGFVLFGVGSAICLMAPSLTIMVIGRIVQGVGLSAPRSIAISIIRDTYKGDYMARIMSFVTAFFILVPVIAPATGKWIMDVFNWEGIFYVQLFFAVIIGIWFWKRQPETLKPIYKMPFSLKVFTNGTLEFIKHKETVAFTLTSGFITGAFLVYLSGSQHVFEDQYGLVVSFPYIFAGLAVSIGLSTLLNGALVMRFGMRRLALMALTAFCAIAILYVMLFWNQPNPGILVLVAFFVLTVFLPGLFMGNFRSIAMEPIGHIAGIGAAINGFVSTVIAVPIASFISRYVVDTVWPMFIGLVCGLISLAIMLSVRKRKAVASLSRG